MNRIDDPKSKIKEWLSTQGYPLEMKVAAAFRKAGFEVIQSHYYIDPENNNYREIDVVAIMPDPKLSGVIDISFVVECKTSKKKPWLLFSSDRILERWNILFSYCINSDRTREALIKKGFDRIKKLLWMNKKGRIAYGLTQAFTSGDDITYKAAISVLKATISRKKQLEKRIPAPFMFIFPVIIIEGQLFECFLSDKGQLSIIEFENGFFHFPFSIADEPGTCIHILSSNKLTDLCSQAKNVSNTLLSLLQNDIDRRLELLSRNII
ncbi:MAG: hypothetical protein KAW56_14395 [Candidatus Marinimicrobia bacterium]|nr:hypothetical protein [candidate division WOR-3 bacterium]MCK4448258.1 hypothetical protein [Candidatus Neomarinimicrobiota bacterium]